MLLVMASKRPPGNIGSHWKMRRQNILPKMLSRAICGEATWLRVDGQVGETEDSLILLSANGTQAKQD